VQDPASEVYVRMKKKAAEKAGFVSRQITLPAETSEDELLGMVDGLNADPEVHGILVQLPLPKHIDSAASSWPSIRPRTWTASTP
jgi:methylenetetrahydrofolate dehydrogenase (NADP+) / methenyltetrahydrofolate cyclohydrolase